MKLFSNGKVSYLTVSTDYILIITNNDKVFQGIKCIFKENFEIHTLKCSIMKYSNLRISQLHLGFSIDQNYHIM